MKEVKRVEVGVIDHVLLDSSAAEVYRLVNVVPSGDVAMMKRPE